MKHLFLTLLLATACVAQKAAPDPKENARSTAKRNGVQALLDLSYANNTNPKQMVDLYLPEKRNSDKPLPVVALIHGGGWVNGDRIGYAATGIQLARTGDYAAVCVGYRLTKEAHWPQQAYDVKAAIRWIRGHAKEYNLDPDRIGAMGSSAGGHLVSLLGTSGEVKELEGTLGSHVGLSSRVHCVVNLCGPEDFTKALMFDNDGKPVIKDDAVSGLLGGTSEEQPALAVAASPVTYVTKDDPPFLTLHGDADKRVAFTHANLIHAALQKVGVSSLLIPITGGGHSSVSHPEGRERSKQFFDLHLRDVKTDISTEPLKALPVETK